MRLAATSAARIPDAATVKSRYLGISRKPGPFHFTSTTSSSSLIISLISLPPRLRISMLSRRVLVASRFLRAHRAPHLRYPLPVVQQFRSYADRVIKVPQMAESISEGTLKQWSKQIGEFVEQDEEIATIETDKASLAYSRRSHENTPAHFYASRSM